VTWLSAACAAVALALSLPPPTPGVAPSRPRRRRGWARPVAALGAGTGAALLVGGHLAPVAGLVCAGASWWVLRRAEPPSARREREQVARTLPHLIQLYAATLRAGSEPVAGLRRVCVALPGPAADRLAPVVEHARWGAGGVEAWRVVEDDDALVPLVRAMVRSHASGASVVEVVERLADELERESLARAEDAARRVGVAAAVPLGVCLLPAFLLLGVVPTVAAMFGSVAP
jgi:Flp pilus assembly protein TadB